MSTELRGAHGGQPQDDSYVLEESWKLHPNVSVRTERFGALLYHFGTRRLTFLKDPRMCDVVVSMSEHATTHAALAAAGVGPNEEAGFVSALAQLARTQMLVQIPKEEGRG